MKQIFYLCLALCLSTNLSAQLQKNASSFSLTGGLSLDSYNSYHLAGDYRYMLSDRLMMGMGIEGSIFANLSSPGLNEQDYFYYTALLSPSARYYLSPKNKQLQWFVEGRVGLGNTRFPEVRSLRPNGETVLNNRFTSLVEFSGGASRFLTPGLMLEGQMGYRSYQVQGRAEKLSLFFDIRLRPFFNNFDKITSIETNKKWLVDGHFHWDYALNGIDDNNLDFKLEALRFLSPKFALGGLLSYNNNAGNEFEAKVQGRYYLNPRQRLQVFLQGEAGLEIGTFLNGDSKGTIWEPSANVKLGFNYYLNNRLSLEYTTGFGWGGNRGVVVTGQLGLKYLIGK